MHWTLTPAYGRDYRSKASVQADWAAGKDFVTQPEGRYASRRDAIEAGLTTVNIRYGNLRKVGVFDV